MILVTGATGFLGLEICRVLAGEGEAVRGMVRKSSDSGKVFVLNELGVELDSGDLRDPSSFDKLLKDVDIVISTASSVPYSYMYGKNNLNMVDRAGTINLINASQKAGVKKFIYTSLSGNINVDFPLRNVKREVECYLKESGMDYCIIRSGFFMESWLSDIAGYDRDTNTVSIIGHGSNPVSYISILDVAKFIVEGISNPAGHNKVLEIGGSESITQLEMVNIFEKTIGHPLKRNTISLGEVKRKMALSADPMERSLAGLMYCLAKGDPIDMSQTLNEFNIRPRTVKDYARCVLAEAYTYDFY